MIPERITAIILILPLLTMIRPSLAYWKEYKREKKKENKGAKAQYGFSFFLFVAGVFGMWFSWLLAIISFGMGSEGNDFILLHWAGMPVTSSFTTQLAGFIVFLTGAVTYNLTIIYAGKYLRPAPSGTLRDHVLIAKGPFSVIRHPLYVSYLLVAVGLGFLLLNYLPAVSALFLAIGIYPAAKAEEAVLMKQLGKDYIAYQKHVGMLFPRVTK